MKKENRTFSTFFAVLCIIAGLSSLGAMIYDWCRLDREEYEEVDPSGTVYMDTIVHINSLFGIQRQEYDVKYLLGPEFTMGHQASVVAVLDDELDLVPDSVYVNGSPRDAEWITKYKDNGGIPLDISDWPAAQIEFKTTTPPSKASIRMLFSHDGRVVSVHRVELRVCPMPFRYYIYCIVVFVTIVYAMKIFCTHFQEARLERKQRRQTKKR